MSKFSGKNDFYDTVEIFGIDYILNCKVFVGKKKEPEFLLVPIDCVPLYPHIVTAAIYDRANETGYIRLSEKSWVDMEEERCGKMKEYEIYRRALQEELEKAKISGYSV